MKRLIAMHKKITLFLSFIIIIVAVLVYVSLSNRFDVPSDVQIIEGIKKANKEVTHVFIKDRITIDNKMVVLFEDSDESFGLAKYSMINKRYKLTSTKKYSNGIGVVSEIVIDSEGNKHLLVISSITNHSSEVTICLDEGNCVIVDFPLNELSMKVIEVLKFDNISLEYKE